MFIKNKKIAITIDLTSVGTTSTITVKRTANHVSAEIEKNKLKHLFNIILEYYQYFIINYKIANKLANPYRKSSIPIGRQNNMVAQLIKHRQQVEQREPKEMMNILVRMYTASRYEPVKILIIETKLNLFGYLRQR